MVRLLPVMSGVVHVRTRAVYMTDCRIIPATARNAGGLNHFLRRCPRE